MRQYPKSCKESQRLAPEPWMLEQLRLNPDYPHWGPHEDYMAKDGDSWNSRVICESWTKFGPWQLDDWNEVVHFYFSINRPARCCDNCGGKGRHPDAQWVTESWYSHTSPFTKPDEREFAARALMRSFGAKFEPGILGRGVEFPPPEVVERYGLPFMEHCVSVIENGGHWSAAITQDEVDALWEQHRLRSAFKERPSAAEVNELAKRSMLHDSINYWICSGRRCKRLGIPYDCQTCEGYGELFTGPARLDLTLWVLHPRKGASRGVEVQNILHSDLPAVHGFLKEAAARNLARFSKVIETVGDSGHGTGG